MFGFLKKKNRDESQNSDSVISEEKLSGFLETIIANTKLEFNFIEGIDVLEKEVFGDILHAKLLLKHKNGSGLEISESSTSIFFSVRLYDLIEREVFKHWGFEFEDLLSNLRKATQIASAEEFDKYKDYKNEVVISYLGTRYEMPIAELIRFDDKLREAKLEPLYADVKLIDKYRNSRCLYHKTLLNIYGIAKWWIDIHE